ncbi:hypothetical protein COW36_16100 [bacterium (Candidatus Blackallbacteria) CG17_big_fil_post_rev_8_21_14_2_50_48_46]|uniref:Uncharacterized protein n=1 Tax=bacterium (Candidatus Blackallbacteria) CG17_big_fil_post_rev_8_21_14_2_50_48_46 TaxID=2014261 RepID=A0A2M7G1U8_9BACT|nr:MAG: hypothetical protein COW64_08565 [bacterium (Candidatus Blackallbacteria) CG18_big_fil_WC_8_21_14_2_50_49_26]PIW15725.1 MAG: hypothetical protein COW36_16100 [bacterium (Candidatus Blackallbacteria) CG17_big_fil_post_rev_8_21_14_2_50_48_46]PIW49227.1 MAG: hypothetical protein COW20_06610 [bacterium (Candidatus Blackallbacteria) CG13_big_fil_rev_8_21_14_2_50_49_14]
MLKSNKQFKILALSLGFSLAATALSPSAYAADPIPGKKVVEIMIRQDLFSNQRVIRDISLDLSMEEKALLYMNFEKQPMNTALFNILPTFGSASYQQGDLFGGISMTLLDGLGWSMIAGSLLAGGYSSGYYLWSGMLCFGLGRVIGLTSPFMHAGLYNATLKESLALDGRYSTRLKAESLVNVGWSF